MARRCRWIIHVRANIEDAVDFPPTGTPRDFLTGCSLETSSVVAGVCSKSGIDRRINHVGDEECVR